MNIEVLDHTIEKVSLLVHTAIIKVDKEITPDNAFVEKVSEEVGYHPLGYGIYFIHYIDKLYDNTYVIRWETGSHCD